MLRDKSGRRSRRRGFTILVVLAFILILLSMLGVAYRQTASVLRVGAARSSLILHDQECMKIAARAVALLETDTPPSVPIEMALDPADPDSPMYQVTFTSDPSVSGQWVISVAPL